MKSLVKAALVAVAALALSPALVACGDEKATSLPPVVATATAAPSGVVSDAPAVQDVTGTAALAGSGATSAAPSKVSKRYTRRELATVENNLRLAHFEIDGMIAEWDKEDDSAHTVGAVYARVSFIEECHSLAPALLIDLPGKPPALSFQYGNQAYVNPPRGNDARDLCPNAETNNRDD